MASFDFPSSPTEGQEYTPTGGPTYVYRDGKWLVAKSAPAAAAASLVKSGARFRWPMGPQIQGGGPALTSWATIDASGEYAGAVMQAPENLNIVQVGFRNTNASASPRLDVRIETVDLATGLPTGTLWAANTNILSPVLVLNGWNLLTLTAPAVIPKGAIFAVKLLWNVGQTVVLTFGGGRHGALGNLFYFTNNTGTPAKAQQGTAAADLVLGPGGGDFYCLEGLTPTIAVTQSTFASPERRGLRFQVPFKCRCIGLVWPNATSTGDAKGFIYNDAGTPLTTMATALDGTLSASQVAGVTPLYFDDSVILIPGTWYRAVLEPTTATVITMTVFQLPSAAYRAAYPHGLNAHYTTYSGSWVDTATDTLPCLDLILDQVLGG